MDQTVKTDSIYRVFADNLRQHCARYGSIAAFCRDSGINRQQFNRYLSGQNLPNPHNLKRICATLRVSETSLFAAAGVEADLPLFLDRAGLNFLTELTQGLSPQNYAAMLRLAKVAQRASGGSHVRPGTYLVYSPFTGSPGLLICAALKVTAFGNLMAFTRHTSFRPPDAHPLSLTVGRHVGLVLSDANATKFIGMNRLHPHEISVMHMMHSVTGPEAPRLGLSLYKSPSGDMACRSIMCWLGKDKEADRRALALIGAKRHDDPSLPATVKDFFSQPTEQGQYSNVIEVKEQQLATQQLSMFASGKT
jgi:transcriptional regulator with XRE-family HTH domain